MRLGRTSRLYKTTEVATCRLSIGCYRVRVPGISSADTCSSCLGGILAGIRLATGTGLFTPPSLYDLFVRGNRHPSHAKVWTLCKPDTCSSRLGRIHAGIGWPPELGCLLGLLCMIRRLAMERGWMELQGTKGNANL